MPSAWSGCWSTESRPSPTASPTGELPGALLESGRDTATVDPSGCGLIRRLAGVAPRPPTLLTHRQNPWRQHAETADPLIDRQRRWPSAAAAAAWRHATPTMRRPIVENRIVEHRIVENERGPTMGSPIPRDETQLLIGGQWVEAGDGTYDIVNPATEEVVGQAPNASVADAEAAAAAAREALPAWAATPAEERLALLKKAAGAIRAKNDELVPLVIAETGATASVGSRMQVPVCADRFDRYSRDIRHVQEQMLPPIVSAATPLAPGGLISALAYRQPVGVVAAIASYNFPLTNMAGKVAPALAMGNTVVMKPAPQDPLAVVELARVLDEVGFPPGVVNLVIAEGPEPGVGPHHLARRRHGLLHRFDGGRPAHRRRRGPDA